MSEKMNDNLDKFEEIESLLSVEEKDADEDKKNDTPVFMTDIHFKEALETGDLLDEGAFSALDPEDQKGYALINVVTEETKEPMGWMFRDKADAEVEDVEVKEDADVADVADVAVVADETEGELSEDPTDSVDEKAASIMMQMAADDEEEMPSMVVPDSRLKQMEDDDDLITEEKYDGLDEDAKDSYEAVDVYDENSGKGYGKRYRRRSPLEVNAMRKGEFDLDAEKADEARLVMVATDVAEKVDGGIEDMFDTEEDALERAAVLGCEGTHGAGDKFMPCATHDEWQKLSADKPEATPEAAPDVVEKADDFLCGFQRKSVGQPCDFCQGGCAPEDGLPSLAEVESVVKMAHPGEIVGSGYSSTDDMFVIDVKCEDGTFIEVFLSGEGDELGWLRVDESLVAGKSAEELNIISSSDAEAVAVKALDDMELDVKGQVMGIMVDVFADEDVYVVELDSGQKSFDFYVSVEGKVLGYDEYDTLDDVAYAMSEEDEIKALEAELEIKRMYSREQRESMAESGEAMDDGSFPIADEADLKNALAAFQRAKDVDAAKAHIAKRAKELGLEEMIPEDFATIEGDAAEAEKPEAEVEVEDEKSGDSDLFSALEEFRSLMDDGLS